MIQVGQIIGNYKITAKLGEGGMGVVYLAEHPIIGRKVAIKAIHPELSRNPEVVSRFMTEAKSVNQIGNEHIVDVSDFGNTPEGEFYFIMEFLQGEALADCLRRERLLQTDRALQIAAQVADALAAAHAHGIVHRDLKPENIFLITRGQTQDFVKVLDFGLAKLTQGDEKVSHKTRTGSVMGTPYYMAPEQCEGKAGVDHRADVYSLGVILFEMMTGRVPFGGEGYGEIIVKHLTMPPPAPRDINPAITPAQQAVVLRALTKPRDARFSSMEEFRAAILDPEKFAGTGRAARLAGGPGQDRRRQQQPLAARERPRLRGREAGPDALHLPARRRGAGRGDPGPRSRKGLFAGVAVAVVVAAAAVFVLKKPSDEAVTAAAAQPAPRHAGGPVAPAAAPVPAPPRRSRSRSPRSPRGRP